MGWKKGVELEEAEEGKSNEAIGKKWKIQLRKQERSRRRRDTKEEAAREGREEWKEESEAGRGD